MNGGKRWTVYDRYSNNIYLTHERWQHITENHPEMSDYEESLKKTILQGHRKQDPLNMRKYRYVKSFDNLATDNTHIVAVVLFGVSVGDSGKLVPNNYIVTAYQKEIG
ncbi:hypothetical protein PN36_35435 [Candidatus Thiomargarita nelsonii]|uniref:Uncharacterized protein n=1 Tax=Candidatus Thiomargarita nelsonii TaxID=1003181 RepID=A0A0A6P141_9GAMM|nr:hypothetical protein PN36_35435 [Candidatus Thiomargarita nelsonii]